MWMSWSTRAAATVVAVGTLGTFVVQGQAARESVPNSNRAVAHALNRLAFGARPGEAARVQQMGLARWIDAQLQPRTLADDRLAPRLARLSTLTLDPQTIATDYVLPARRSRQQRLGSQTDPDMAGPPEASPRDRAAAGAMSEVQQRQRAVFTDLAEAKILRAVYSERQLEEVLVDFWFNHFNVFARKGQTEIYVSQYEREAIRPFVLGRFRDLLGATAKSPAMLFYLDNWMSADPDAASRARPRAQARRAAGQPVPARMSRGLNENYARELLELHTLGVDGGYSQADVVAVARAFTGWTIGRPDQPGFRFVPMLHDREPKTVLGQTIPANGGIADGERVLDLLASHPSTARHLAFKLAQRFVSDTPPPALVERAAATFRRTDGDLREVVRTIVTSPEFFDPSAYRAKVKTPFELVVSALRVTGGEVRSALALQRVLAGLGMPLYLCQPPTGYDETADVWVSSGALVSRMNFAVALANGQLRGVQPLPIVGDRADRGDRGTEVPRYDGRREAGQRDDGTTAEAARATLIRDALADDISGATRATVEKAVTAAQVVALTLGSPEFQRQ